MKKLTFLNIILKSFNVYKNLSLQRINGYRFIFEAYMYRYNE